MAQLSVDERRSPRLSRIVAITLIAALLTAGWFVSQYLAVQLATSLAQMLPRL